METSFFCCRYTAELYMSYLEQFYFLFIALLDVVNLPLNPSVAAGVRVVVRVCGGWLGAVVAS